MSPLEPDELARLLTQAVEPIRASPEGYQRIRAGIERRRRMRLPLYVLAGVAVAAVFALVALALQPGQGTQVVEPAGPINGSVGGTGPDGLLTSTDGVRIGSGGGQVGAPTGQPSAPVTPRTSAPGSAPTGAATANPTATATRPPGGGSPTMPAPVYVPARNGDIDGDGVADTVAMAGTGIEVTLSRSKAVIVPMPLPITPLRYTVFDVDGNGYGEILVRTATVSGVEHYRMLRLTAPDLIFPVGGGGTALDAGIDTGSGDASGFRCTAGGIVTYSGTPAGGGTYTVDTQPWRLQGTDLVADAGGSTMSTADTSLFRPDCGTL